MSQDKVNVGIYANDGTGDPLRNAFIKLNGDFTEAFAELANTSNVVANLTSNVEVMNAHTFLVIEELKNDYNDVFQGIYANTNNLANNTTQSIIDLSALITTLNVQTDNNYTAIGYVNGRVNVLSNTVSTLNLYNLMDVSVVDGPSIDGKYLMWSDAEGKWIANSVSPDVFFSTLRDVNVTPGPGINGYSLVYDDATGKFVAAPGVSTLSGMVDVTVSPGAGIDGKVLMWNNDLGTWIANSVSSTGSSGNANTGDIRFRENFIYTESVSIKFLPNANSFSSWVTNVALSSPFNYYQPIDAAVDSNGNFIQIGTNIQLGEFEDSVRQDLIATKLASNGDVIWSASPSVSSNTESVAIVVDANNNSYVLGRELANLAGGPDFVQSSITKIDPEGNGVWYATFFSYVGPMCISPSGIVFVSDLDYRLVAVDSSTGNTIWTTQITDDNYVGGAPVRSMYASVDTLFVGTSDGRVYAFDFNGNCLWSADVMIHDTYGAIPIVGITSDGTDLYVLSDWYNQCHYIVKVDGATHEKVWEVTFDTTQSSGPNYDYSYSRLGNLTFENGSLYVVGRLGGE